MVDARSPRCERQHRRARRRVGVATAPHRAALARRSGRADADRQGLAGSTDLRGTFANVESANVGRSTAGTAAPKVGQCGSSLWVISKVNVVYQRSIVNGQRGSVGHPRANVGRQRSTWLGSVRVGRSVGRPKVNVGRVGRSGRSGQRGSGRPRPRSTWVGSPAWVGSPEPEATEHRERSGQHGEWDLHSCSDVSQPTRHWCRSRPSPY